MLSFSTPNITSQPKVRSSPSIRRVFSVGSIGKKKLKQVEDELKKLMKIQHDNLLSVFAVKLSSAYSEHDYPRLSILLEQRPSLSLHDVLEDCDFLREDRALVCYHISHECCLKNFSGIHPSSSHRSQRFARKRCITPRDIPNLRLPGQFCPSGTAEGRQTWKIRILHAPSGFISVEQIRRAVESA